MSYFQKMREKVGKETLLLPGAAVIIYTPDEHVLLQRREEGTWGLPGGLMEPGESFRETVKRETEEETGLKLPEDDLHMFGTFTGERYYVEAPNGDPYYAVSAVYTAPVPDQPLTEGDEETLALAWFQLSDLPEELRDSHRHFLAQFQQYGVQKNLLDQ
ncbi:NUDIX hydrolase [Alkalicoccus chagannorensis]|uniref:NUDIX hydrolase n=1 Tax=Alkalicoccus chagannorensis TaxID=427072 RepID=UPI00047E4B78|nr:NUDIX domain-containing protein [Alkalicoccus chagannorensis]